MAWVKLDDGFYRHPKALRAGPRGRDLFVCGLCYCGQYLTDGFIPAAAVPALADSLPRARPTAERLVEVGLWEKVDGGYRVHDYLDWQPTAEGVKARRDSGRQRLRLWRLRHASNGVGVLSTTTWGVTPHVTGSDEDVTRKKHQPRTRTRTRPSSSSPVSKETVEEDEASSAPPEFRIAIPITDALNKCRRLGAVAKLREPSWWQAEFRANSGKGIDYPAHLFEAEAYLATVPANKYSNLAQFLHNSFSRVPRPT